MTKEFDLLVYIGRFQPPHKAHIQTIERALKLSEKVFVGVGSYDEERTLKNPWVWEDRVRMINSNFEEEWLRLMAYPLRDIPESNERWAKQVKDASSLLTRKEDRVGIIGHHKDASSFYLDLFPEWELIEMENTCGTNATDIREKYFNLPDLDMSWANDLPLPVVDFLKEFRNTKEFKQLKGE